MRAALDKERFGPWALVTGATPRPQSRSEQKMPEVSLFKSGVARCAGYFADELSPARGPVTYLSSNNG